MKGYKITNFVIVVLVIAAVYQTGEVWLAGTTSHNFFHVLWQNVSAAEDEVVDGNALLATRYAIGDGGSNFSVYYPDQVGSSDTLQVANTVLQEILAENIGEDTQVMQADWKEILQNRCIVMQYDFMILSEEYLAGMRSLKNAQKLEQFDYITIVPARRAGEESLAYFVNSDTEECVVYRANKSKTAPALYQSLMTAESDMVYISTGQKTSSAVLRRNLFLPQWAELPYAYHTVRQEAAFEQDGAVSRALLESTAERFFRNFSVDWSDRDETGNFVFSDSSVVLRYYPAERVLEYFNYDNYGNDGDTTKLLEGYQISCNFMANDASLVSDVYLADIAFSGNEIVYYFDYVVNHLPVYLSEQVQEEIGSAHAIEITVRNDSVRKYRRFAVNYTAASTTDAKLDVQFIDALDMANRQYQETIAQREIADVKNIALGYYADRTEGIRLQWFVNLYDEVFVIDTDSAAWAEETSEEAS